MIAKCEKCQTAFNIEDNLIKEIGTKFRCSSCKHVFTVYPPAQPEPLPVQEQEDVVLSDNDTMTMVDFSEKAFDLLDQTGPRYIELGSIGEGGMGEVKMAKDTQLLRKVAVKKLKKEAASPATLSYFFREAQITAQLDHPNIVPLYTVKQPDHDERNVSFVMKYIKGQTLTDIINKARNIYKENPKAELPTELNLNSRLGYFLKACDGIIYSHRKEVIHRDLKPSNIMIGDYGEVYVMDWGIAKMIKEVPETLYGIQKIAARKSDMYIGGTEVGSVVGTPGYISPEQVKGLSDVGAPSDQFSLGVILYELITLKPARPGDMNKKLEWAREGEINQIVHMMPDKKIPPELKAVVKKATAVNPNNRYLSVALLAEDVRGFLRGDEVSVMPDNIPRKMWRLINKHRHVTAILVLSILLISFAITTVTLINEKDAMKAARKREKTLTHMLTKVATQAHYIDTRFIRLEDLLVNLANNAMFMIQNPAQNNEQFYWQDDFKNPKKAPADLLLSSLYKREVSIKYPVVKAAPGVKHEDIIPMMQRLAPLRHHFQKMLLDSRSNFTPISSEEAMRLLTIHGLPISWAYLGLEAGVMYSYPGKGSYPDNYDPRVRPWYKLGAKKSSVHWGNPYIDLQGLGMVLPCAMSLYDNEGRFYGVAGMDVTYSNIIHDSLTRSGAVGVVESFLLDDKGRIVVSSSQLGIDFELYSSDSALHLELFPVTEVVDKIKRKESGLVEVTRGEESRIVFFHEIQALDWYYVEEVKTEAILGADK
ncbi:Protein kinase, Zinc finger domain-containing and double cache domain-containing [Desulfonema limicola]|uniref:Protein kinase, Zinc finger domain-containing and double cache domain-containing n=1 Tax=Desulfonema limicola TaxID=45656 RepID=A0A975B5U5_9BACT|nr:protein kinase [Desulfonema limicola]QTA79337.1 Protein kinase, Zinc finger domain-containing and double cache domain-containing [Desulfonema limicola]